MKIIQSLLKSYILDKNAYIELRETNFFILIMLYMISRIPYFLVFRIYEEISIQILGKKIIFDFLLILFRILLLLIFNQLFIKKYDNKSIGKAIVSFSVIDIISLFVYPFHLLFKIVNAILGIYSIIYIAHFIKIKDGIESSNKKNIYLHIAMAYMLAWFMTTFLLIIVNSIKVIS